MRLVFFLCILSLGCGGAGQPAPEAPADNSLSMEELAVRGMPSPDHPWSPDELAQAGRVVSGLTDGRKLPRHGSPRSGQMFARMVDPANFARISDEKVPDRVRMPLALEYQDASRGIMHAYLQAQMSGQIGDREMAEISGCNLRLAVPMFRMLARFEATLDKEDPTYEVRKQGMAQARLGVSQMLAGGCQMIDGIGESSPGTIESLIASLTETAPSLLGHLQGEAKETAIKRFAAMASDPRLAKHRAGLEALRDKVRTAK